MSTPEKPVYLPDKIKVQLFKVYTIEYTDIYGRKCKTTSKVKLSEGTTVLERETLSRWKQFDEGTFPTSDDKTFAEAFHWLGNTESFKSATVGVIQSLLHAIEGDKYISGDLETAAKTVIEGLGGKFDYSEYKARESKETTAKKIRENVEKEVKK